jgi:hypothetical protein
MAISWGAGLCLLAACGGAASPALPTTPHATTHHAAREPIDVLAALLKPPREVAWIIPGSAQLELGGASVQAPEAAEPLEVEPLDERGNDVRLGVRLDHVRFAIWTQRARLLAIALRDVRVEDQPNTSFTTAPIEVRLRATALVRRIAHQKSWTKIRYAGALEINGWVPDDALGDRTQPGKQPLGRIPTGRTTLAVFPGAVIRAEPHWGSRELAVMATGYFIDEVNPIDDAWSEVAYEDGDIDVHGYLSRRDPPGRVHRAREADSIVPVQTNATLPAGTCLYASEGGEPVGTIVSDAAVALEPTHPGWFSVAVETPFGAIAFSARGATEGELATCGVQ